MSPSWSDATEGAKGRKIALIFLEKTKFCVELCKYYLMERVLTPSRLWEIRRSEKHTRGHVVQEDIVEGTITTLILNSPQLAKK